MTVETGRTTQMSVEEFETIASAAPETVTLEFLNGRLGVKRTARRGPEHRPDLAGPALHAGQARP